MNIVETSPDPQQSASRAELGQLLEEALLDPPEQYRTVVMLPDVEEMSTSETAAVLDLTEHNVKVRCIEAALWHVAGFLRVSARTQRLRFHLWAFAAIALFMVSSRGLQS